MPELESGKGGRLLSGAGPGSCLFPFHPEINQQEVKMKNLVFAILVVLSICAFPAFAETAHAAQKASILPKGRTLKPLQQPLVADPSAMLPLCSSLPQALEKVTDTLDFLWKGLNCEGNFPKYIIENYQSHVNGCCSPQKSFSVQEQQAAGCLNNDTVKQCMDKLTGYCINNVAEKNSLKNRLEVDPKRAADISIKMKELSGQLIKLRSLMP
jgi:hypothetical protein